MYHRFVAGKVRGAFAQISAGNWEAMVTTMAPTFTYRFYGEHALSGERHTAAALRRWWERSFRLMPNPHFEVRDVIVSGPPWATKVATLVSVSATLPGGTAYSNIFTQFMRMSWGRITDIKTWRTPSSCSARWTRWRPAALPRRMLPRSPMKSTPHRHDW